jgi:two-component system, NtrC family, response regulator AtoC
MKPQILIIDDDRELCGLLGEILRDAGYEVTWRSGEEEAIALLHARDFDLVITDLNLGGASGIEICQWMRDNRPTTPVVVITGFGDMSSAIQAIRAGAHDFLPKPIEAQLLEHAVDRALRMRHLREQVRRLKIAEVPSTEGVGSLIGASRAMRDVYDVIRRVAASDTTVLLSGESGTGKELVASAIHELSGRAGRFVGINCAAMPAELLESELFGHVRGAFTDAKSNREGLFEQASGGTLLLDEVGEMPLDMQPKLLRVLQERVVRPVGGNTLVEMTARLIAATNRDLEEEVEARHFREDLFYRLNVVQIHIPPLRARGNDVLLLAQHFVERFAGRVGKTVRGISPEAQRRLLAYDWPGNVRQLENAIERAVALMRGEEVQVEDLPERVVHFVATTRADDDVDLENVLTLDELERRQIERAIRQHHGNKTRAAKALAIDRRTLYRKLERYEGARPASKVSPREPERTSRV